jgi:flagellar FliJ protein
MKRFVFPLRPVAVLRSHRELCAREALAAAIEACIQAEERGEAAQLRVQDLARAICGARRGNLSPGDEIAFSQIYRRECAAEIEAQKQAAAARRLVDERREAYVEASRQVKMVSRLEERARAAHRMEGLRLEQAGLDEIAGRRIPPGGFSS